MSPDSSAVFITGMIPGSSGASAATTIGHATATGAPPWARQYQGPQGNNAGNTIAVSPDGSQVFITGFLGAHDGCCNFLTIAYQP